MSMKQVIEPSFFLLNKFLIFEIVNIEVNFFPEILLDLFIGEERTGLKVQDVMMYSFENTKNNTQTHKFEHVDFLEQALVLGDNFTQRHETVELAIEEDDQIFIEDLGFVVFLV